MGIVDGYRQENTAETSGAPDAKRLTIRVVLSPTSASTLNHVRYTITLNPEAKPFLAAQQLTWDATDSFQVVPDGQSDTQQTTPDGQIITTGFDTTWSPLITDADTLSTDDHLTLADLPKAVKTLTVAVTWDGGEQTETLAIDPAKLTIN